MLTIRPEQVRAMQSTLGFECRMRQHVQTFFPEISAQLGSQGTLQRVREAIQEARTYGITDQRGVCSYINVGFALGSDFPEAPWARKALQGPAEQEGVPKAERLYRLAVEYLVFDAARAGPLSSSSPGTP